MRFQYFHPELIPLGLATMVMVYLDTTKKSHDALVLTFWVCLAANILMVLRFLTSTIQQITEFLGIYCFSIEKRRKVQ